VAEGEMGVGQGEQGHAGLSQGAWRHGGRRRSSA
jgi:hypothetical protein